MRKRIVGWTVSSMEEERRKEPWGQSWWCAAGSLGARAYTRSLCLTCSISHFKGSGRGTRLRICIASVFLVDAEWSKDDTLRKVELGTSPWSSMTLMLSWGAWSCSRAGGLLELLELLESSPACSLHQSFLSLGSVWGWVHLFSAAALPGYELFQFSLKVIALILPALDPS
jgi:hypothetical protein